MTIGQKILAGILLLLFVLFTIASLIPKTNSAKRPSGHAAAADSVAWVTDTIPEGGSLYSVLEKRKLDSRHVAIIAYRFGEYIDVTTIQPGDTLKLQLDASGKNIRKFDFIQEPTIRHHFTVTGDSLVYRMESLPVTERRRLLEGSLKGTLDASLLAAGLDHTAKQQVNNGLEYEINFNRDARNGDVFRVFISERIFENKVLPGTKVLYVSYKGERTGFKELYRFQDPDPKSVLNGLYNNEGKSSNISGTGYPLASIHVVSNFGGRADPFHGGFAFHEGYDYRAHYGTPVFAVANGTVTEARYAGGWGNNVLIRHASGMQSHYAHLSSISVHAGQKVHRGQVIGRVGSTGRSTGAHLHFGLKSGGRWVNPSQLRMVGADKLDAQQMKVFAKQKADIAANMKLYKPTRI